MKNHAEAKTRLIEYLNKALIDGMNIANLNGQKDNISRFELAKRQINGIKTLNEACTQFEMIFEHIYGNSAAKNLEVYSGDLESARQLLVEEDKEFKNIITSKPTTTHSYLITKLNSQNTAEKVLSSDNKLSSQKEVVREKQKEDLHENKENNTPLADDHEGLKFK